MAEFTATANSSTTIGYAYYGSSSWNTGSSSGACQGAYNQSSSSYSRVGIMVFSGAGDALKSTGISSITLSITCDSAGSGSSGKVLTFHKANYQSLTGVSGSAQIGDTLGTLTGKFYGNTTTHTLSASSNSEFFEALRTYLAAGNSALVLYNGETASSGNYSTNYARIQSITITVTYEKALVYYRTGGAWVQCAVYYRLNGAWVRVAPYYRTGGSWIQV